MSPPARPPSQMTHQRLASHEHRQEDRAQGRSGQGRRREDRRPGSEIYPLAVRGTGTSAQAATPWTTNLVITLSLLPILGRIGAGPAMWLYAALNVAAWLFIWRRMPELTGRAWNRSRDSCTAGVSGRATSSTTKPNRRRQAPRTRPDGLQICLRVCPAGSGPRIPVSGRRARSGERLPGARQDSPDGPGGSCSVDGAGRVRDLAARGVAARSGLPRYGVPPGRLPRLPPGACLARANWRACE